MISLWARFSDSYGHQRQLWECWHLLNPKLFTIWGGERTFNEMFFYVYDVIIITVLTHAIIMIRGGVSAIFHEHQIFFSWEWIAACTNICSATNCWLNFFLNSYSLGVRVEVWGEVWFCPYQCMWVSMYFDVQTGITCDYNSKHETYVKHPIL